MKLITTFKGKSKLSNNYLIQGDCIEVMKKIKTSSIPLILCDLPYGVTACKWDVIIPMDKLWEQYKRILTDTGIIVLTATQPFTSMLVMSNLEMYSDILVWEKNRATGFLRAKKAPLNIHEDIIIFSKKQGVYNPQMTEGKAYNVIGHFHKVTDGYLRPYKQVNVNNKGDRYPISIIRIKREPRVIHPTQKPVELFKYLINTYSNPNDLVLDNCSGSGTTAIAALKTGRRFFCIEKEKKYYKYSLNRIKQESIKCNYKLFS